VGRLNTSLIKYLTPLILQTHHIPSIKNAVSSGAFNADIAIFSQAATRFAANEARFSHLYHTSSIVLFYQTLFQWVGALKPSEFRGIIKAALSEYERGRWLTSRRSEVEGYCRTLGQEQALAFTFYRGDSNSDLNRVLFNKIVGLMQTDIRNSLDKEADPGYKLVAQYRPTEHGELYLHEIKACSIASMNKKNTISTIAATTI
jgi:hypothetical protein